MQNSCPKGYAMPGHRTRLQVLRSGARRRKTCVRIDAGPLFEPKNPLGTALSLRAGMAILCGTDFSESSFKAVRAALHLAERQELPLHLVHVIEFGPERTFDAPRFDAERWARGQLEGMVARLGESRVRIHSHVQSGAPDEVLQALASELSAKLIVVAALGQRGSDSWRLGGHAERLAHRSSCPVLLVRDFQAFEAWAQQERPLRIVLGADLSQSCEHAMRWIQRLASFGPCQVTATHLYWPPEQFERLGLAGVRNLLEPDSVVTATLRRDLAARLAEALGHVPVEIKLEPHLGGVGGRLAMLATELGADLLVVGTHGRSGVDWVVRGSVSHAVVHQATMSVACVPLPGDAGLARPEPPSKVLVATDFSEVGNAAVPLAYSVVAPSGVVQLVHVLKERGRHPTEARDIFSSAGSGAEDEVDEARRMLQALVPQGERGRGVQSEVHVLMAGDPALAICQAAERLDAAIVCVGTHGRSGIGKTLLGSVAASVVQSTHRPVLLARPVIER
jgi:nucleotide-binding universal stress UspA family protein